MLILVNLPQEGGYEPKCVPCFLELLRLDGYAEFSMTDKERAEKNAP
jgi:hypothetical protein